MEHRGAHPGQIEELCKRLDDLSAQVAQQAATIAEQRAEIDQLRVTPTMPAAISPPTSVSGGETQGRATLRNRRAAISRVLGATAAGALLALAKQPELASADYRGTA